MSDGVILALAVLFLCTSALSQCQAGGETLVNTTQTDENGTFHFINLSAGCYNVTAYRQILGSMHYLGDARINLTGDVYNLNLSMSRSDDAHYACFQNATANLVPGILSLSGHVYGPNRPGAEPREIAYEGTTVKITAFAPLP